MTKKKTKETASSASTDALFKEDIPRRFNSADVWMNDKIDPKKEKGVGLETSASEDDTLMGRLAKRMASRDYIDKQNLGMGTKASKAATADMSVGQKIEMEHKDTVNAINPKFDPKKAAKMIERDHISEHKKYYNSKTGLPAMERALTKEETQSVDAPNSKNVEEAEWPQKMHLGNDVLKGLGLHKHQDDIKASNSSDPQGDYGVRAGYNMAEQAKNAGNVYNSTYQIKPLPNK